jgi:hypothetical protein
MTLSWRSLCFFLFFSWGIYLLGQSAYFNVIAVFERDKIMELLSSDSKVLFQNGDVPCSPFKMVSVLKKMHGSMTHQTHPIQSFQVTIGHGNDLLTLDIAKDPLKPKEYLVWIAPGFKARQFFETGRFQAEPADLYRCPARRD